MFQGLQDKLQEVFRRLRGEGSISEETLDTALRQIRLALLEADVNYRVVKSFIARIRERGVGQEVQKSLTPAQQVIKIVHSELVALLGEEGAELRTDGSPAVTLLCGLQGSGKTTTAGKLARRLRQRGRQPLLVAADLQRAAAVEQLVQVGNAVSVPVLTPNPGEDALAVVRRSLKVARERGHDVLILDTAGRLHVDETLMAEIRQVAEIARPVETLFVADAMTGQDAVKSAEAFAGALSLSGVILTKLDGDARGGAALSIRAVVGVPIRFVGVGEKVDEFELFHPDRLASRILGMGDILSLIEKAEQGLDKGTTERLAERIVRQEFTLEDLRDQLRQMRRMGPLSQLLELLPRMGPLRGLDKANIDESQLKRVEAIINSMTPRERQKPAILDARRKRRIALGSGTSVQDINRLLKQYREMQKMMKGIGGKWLRRALKQ